MSYDGDKMTENITLGVVTPTERAKMAFVVYRGVLYAFYALVAVIMLNGGAGAIVVWMVSIGFEFISMSTFGTALVGLGMLGLLRAIQYGTDKLFLTQFGVTTKTPKKK